MSGGGLVPAPGAVVSPPREVVSSVPRLPFLVPRHPAPVLRLPLFRPWSLIFRSPSSRSAGPPCPRCLRLDSHVSSVSLRRSILAGRPACPKPGRQPPRCFQPGFFQPGCRFHRRPTLVVPAGGPRPRAPRFEAAGAAVFGSPEVAAAGDFHRFRGLCRRPRGRQTGRRPRGPGGPRGGGGDREPTVAGEAGGRAPAAPEVIVGGRVEAGLGRLEGREFRRSVLI
jgi:hypothetical protein